MLSEVVGGVNNCIDPSECLQKLTSLKEGLNLWNLNQVVRLLEALEVANDLRNPLIAIEIYEAKVWVQGRRAMRWVTIVAESDVGKIESKEGQARCNGCSDGSTILCIVAGALCRFP